MLRRLLNLLTVLSLLLCVAVCVLWVRSYSCSDQTVWRTEDAVYEAGAYPGAFFVSVAWPPEDYEQPGWDYAAAPGGSNSEDAGANAPWSRFGVGLHAKSYGLFGVRRYVRTAHVRYAWPFAMTAFFPALRLATWRPKRSGPLGLCPSCGFDLRATPGRCPECGTMAAPVSA